MGVARFTLPVFVVLLLLASHVAAAPGIALQTTVAPAPDEDVAAPCGYERTLVDPERPIKGVWVIFDRGRDMLRYYGDPDVQAFARRNDLALMLAFHCRSKSNDGDIDVDPSKGLGRMLLAAIDQLAQASKHPELSKAGLILTGFSGTGVLAARFPEFAPDRVRAVVTAAPGHADPLGIDTVRLSSRAASIPQLIIAGGSDPVSGTQRPYDYFFRHFEQGAPWAFVPQNNVPHCCAINAKGVVISWLEQVAVRPFDRSSGVYTFVQKVTSRINTCPEQQGTTLGPPGCQSTTDTWGALNWQAASAVFTPKSDPPRDMIAAGWLPNQLVGREWVNFVRVPQQPITSLP